MSHKKNTIRCVIPKTVVEVWGYRCFALAWRSQYFNGKRHNELLTRLIFSLLSSTPPPAFHLSLPTLWSGLKRSFFFNLSSGTHRATNYFFTWHPFAINVHTNFYNWWQDCIIIIYARTLVLSVRVDIIESVQIVPPVPPSVSKCFRISL